MRRREFIALIGSAAALPLFRVPVARAQEPGRIYRIGALTGAARQAPRMVAFSDELKVLGFVEGQNLNRARRRDRKARPFATAIYRRLLNQERRKLRPLRAPLARLSNLRR
jgi:hypothetical protein